MHCVNPTSLCLIVIIYGIVVRFFFYRKILKVRVLKIIFKKNIYLVKIIMRWIFTCKINEKKSINKKHVILACKTLKF